MRLRTWLGVPSCAHRDRMDVNSHLEVLLVGLIVNLVEADGLLDVPEHHIQVLVVSLSGTGFA